MDKEVSDDICPKCGAPLGPETTTATGKKLRHCSKGSWDAATKKNIGCDYVLWMQMEPQTLDEKCPQCGAPLLLAFTRFGKKMKKCSKGGWDNDRKKPTGCTYIEWINGTTEALDEDCPMCGKKLVLYTTQTGKKMKKCSTAGWDKDARKPTGCKFVEWLKADEYENTGEENLPKEPEN